MKPKKRKLKDFDLTKDFWSYAWIEEYRQDKPSRIFVQDTPLNTKQAKRLVKWLMKAGLVTQICQWAMAETRKRSPNLNKKGRKNIWIHFLQVTC